MPLYVTETLHSAEAAAADGTAFNILGFTNVSFHVVNVGTPQGDIFFEGELTEAGSDWFPLLVSNLAGAQVSTLATISFPGIFHLLPNGARRARARIVPSSGAFTIVTGKTVRLRRGMDYYASETLQAAAVLTGNGTPINVRGMSGVTLFWKNVGTPVGTITFEGSVNDTDWGLTAMLEPGGTYVSSVTETEVGKSFSLPENHGLSQLRARWTRTSGAATVLSGKSPR